MGVDTKAYLKTTIGGLINGLHRIGCTDIDPYKEFEKNEKGFLRFVFKEEKFVAFAIPQSMILYDHPELGSAREGTVFISMNSIPRSRQVIRKLCEELGGVFLENDISGEWEVIQPREGAPNIGPLALSEYKAGKPVIDLIKAIILTNPNRTVFKPIIEAVIGRFEWQALEDEVFGERFGKQD